MQRLLLGATLALATFSAQAQVCYATGGHLAIQTQPGMGFELPAYLGTGDSVQVLRSQPTDNPHHLSDNMRRNFVYVSYPAYRKQLAGKGWVLRHYLVSTLDSTLLPVAAVPARTYITTKVVTTRRYVPVTKTTRSYAETGKVNHVIVTGSTAASAARSYHSGPRGGCYYLSAGGQKVYVNQRYCQ
ncbi:MAG: hypothetical protein ACRYFZ_04245 [Janthinobacterium lividum]